MSRVLQGAHENAQELSRENSQGSGITQGTGSRECQSASTEAESFPGVPEPVAPPPLLSTGHTLPPLTLPPTVVIEEEDEERPASVLTTQPVSPPSPR